MLAVAQQLAARLSPQLLGLALILSGCKACPEPERRSIEELYLEAAAKSKPEQTLGFHGAPNGSPESASLGAPLDQPGWSEPPAGVPVEMAPAPYGLSPSNPAEPFQPVPRIDPPRSGRPAPASGPALVPPPVPAAVPEPAQSGWLPYGARRTAQVSGQTSPQHSSSVVSARGIPASQTPPRVRIDRQIVRAAAQSGGGLVGDIFEQTEIRQALQSLATQAGVSVIVDEQVAGEVTAVIENRTFDQALRELLLPLGLYYRVRDGQYLICPADPQAHLFSAVSVTEEYRPLYLSPQELQQLLSPKTAPFVRVVEKRNLMVIEAPEEITQRILSALQQADQPVPQVVLEAIICVVNPESGFQFGLDWNHALTVSGTNVVNLGITGLTLGGSASPHGINHAFDDFAVTSAFVKLLAQEGYLGIRAAPRVMAKDGEEAKINIGRETYFSILPNAGASGQFFFQQNIEKVEAGISLEIIPTIRGDTIQIQIEKAEVSEDIRANDPSAVSTTNPYPQINRRTVKTMVNVKDGHSIVIGGLVQRQLVDRESKVPVLGDIPGIRPFFRKTEQQERDVEVVIFISPKIVMPGEG